MASVEKTAPPKDEEVSDSYESQTGESHPGKTTFFDIQFLTKGNCTEQFIV